MAGDDVGQDKLVNDTFSSLILLSTVSECEVLSKCHYVPSLQVPNQRTVVQNPSSALRVLMHLGSLAAHCGELAYKDLNRLILMSHLTSSSRATGTTTLTLPTAVSWKSLTVAVAQVKPSRRIASYSRHPPQTPIVLRLVLSRSLVRISTPECIRII